MKNYVLNKETQKIELHFSKEEYKALGDEEKKVLKSAYLFSGKAQAWVSRSTNNHYSALRVAEKLGFADGGSIGERLSFEEELNIKTEKAENRTERYEQYSSNAEKRAENLQKEFNSHHGDISYFTQPIIAGHAGSQAFARQREKIFARFEKGFEEYRKSDYYKEKAATAQETANKVQLKDPVYLNNRIVECNKSIKQLEKNVVYYEDIIYKKQNNDNSVHDFYKNKTVEDIQNYLNETLEKMEYNIDKLAYLQNCMDEINQVRQQTGRKIYTKDDIKAGYLVKIRGSWETVLKVNKTTVEAQPLQENIKMFILKYPFAEIQDMKIPEGWQEPKAEIENPYSVNDILVSYSVSGTRIIKAYQVIKTTAKGVQLQSIKIEGNKPIKDSFTTGKAIRKQITKSKYSDFIGCYDDGWELNKYVA